MATSGRRAKRSASNMPAASAYPQRPAMRGSRVPTAVWLVLLLCALIAGLFVGHFVFREKVNFGKLNGQTVITEKQLDDAVATYVYEGETYEVTARDAIAQASSLDSVTAGDGKYLAPSAESVLSAARTAILMREVDARGITVPALLEVNVSGEESKSGFSPDEARESVEDVLSLPGLDLRGLMTMAPAGDPDMARRTFSGLRELAEDLRMRTGLALDVLSCGMSDDYGIAVEEGSTLVRLGRIVFDPAYPLDV